MLLHCVFFSFDDGQTVDEQHQLLTDLGALRDQIDGMLDYRFGPNRDFEDKSPHQTGFICTFRDHGAYQAYMDHPRHKELGARLTAMASEGYAGITVYDLETAV